MLQKILIAKKIDAKCEQLIEIKLSYNKNYHKTDKPFLVHYSGPTASYKQNDLEINFCLPSL